MSEQARRGYEGYAKSTGGKTFDGRDMPKWDELPPRIQEAWRDAIAAAVDALPRTESMTDVQVRMLDEMGAVALGKRIKAMLPTDKAFMLWMADYGSQGNLAYISTVDRDDAIRMAREWLKKQGAL